MAFDDPEKFLEALDMLDYNLCIMDIEMPKLNGMEVAKRIKGCPVIFTTAYKEHAAEAFELNAVDYILKPIQKDRLEKALAKALLLLNSQPAEKLHARFNTDKGKSVLLFAEILYITSAEGDKRDKVVYLENEQRLTLKNISYEQLLGILPADQFCRVNKKDVVALKAVRSYSHEVITTKLVNKSKAPLLLPLNDTYRAAFKSKLS